MEIEVEISKITYEENNETKVGYISKFRVNRLFLWRYIVGKDNDYPFVFSSAEEALEETKKMITEETICKMIAEKIINVFNVINLIILGYLVIKYINS